VWRRVIDAAPWGNKPHHLLHDHDGVYGSDFRQRDEQHLRSVLGEFVQYYNLERAHRQRLETPLPVLRSVEGAVRSRPVLGSTHHVYNE
jgi:hypothetical protein